MNIDNTKFIKKLPTKLYDPTFIQSLVFSGEIIVFENSIFINKIIETTRYHFNKIFGVSLEGFFDNRDNLTFEAKERFFFQLQKKIKKCSAINNYFSNFLDEIGFDIKYVFKDQYSIRYSPKLYRKPFGKLKPAPPHRDTWASNLFDQINFWFPIHKISAGNSIYLVPKYFNKKIENNSKSWSFENFKKKDDYPSAPFTKINIQESEKLSFKIDKGDIICFSGHHLHGSLQNKKERINLETRIIYKSKLNKIIIPKNYDSNSNVVKKKWFRNIVTNKYLD